ncbi:Phosphoenolpyruvate carboxykinase (ATP) [Trichinella spiralis]|uniref:Phosphoenolpyruvate carboxykinase (ATP) n=1 Tax=Trichinella spiralis TaxID=6334 RepID=A0ABR3K2P8_TRISP
MCDVLCIRFKECDQNEFGQPPRPIKMKMRAFFVWSVHFYCVKNDLLFCTNDKSSRISISGGKETKTNSPSSGERNEKSPYTEVGEQLCSLDWGFRAGAGPITNDVLCMVSRLLIESGCLRLQPKAGGKSHPRLNIRTRPIANKYREGKQTDGADGAILTKISRRWVRWRMNLLQTCLCRLSFDSNLRTVHFWSISVTSNVRKCFAADILLLSQLPCHCRISRMNVVVDKMKSIVLRSIVMGLLVPLRSWVSAHDLSGTIVDQSVSERAHWYPKDGELCLSRMKPEETLVEVRSGVDVQITRLT